MSITAAGHTFYRYLMSNPHAEEMKCSCGYTIWPCWTEKEAENAIISISGKLITHVSNSNYEKK